MAKAQLKKQQIEDTNNRLLAVTRELVAEGGWAAAQVSVIASRSNLATGSVYRYFDSKADLCVQVLAQVSEREAQVVAAIVDTDGTATDRLRDAVTMFVRRAARQPRLAYALIAEPCEPQIDEARLTYRSALAARFERLIVEGIARGEFVDMPSVLLSTCVIGAMMEPLVQPLARATTPQRHEIEALATNVAMVCVRMVRAAEPRLSSVRASSARRAR